MRGVRAVDVRAAWWAWRAVRRTRRLLASGGLDAALWPPPPPPLPDSARRGMRVVLRWRRERCLVRSIVLQAWEAAQGRPKDLIVGVTGADDFGAHAWLEGEDSETLDGRSFEELLRRPARGAPAPLPNKPLHTF